MPRKEDFTPGDFVKLKGGGPRMTVDARYYHEDSDGSSRTEYLCVWFAANGEHCESTFGDATLEQSFEGE